MNITVALYVLAVASVVLSLFILIPPPPAEASQVEDALHYHAAVRIIINSQDIPIPANVGLTETSAEIIHTHDWDGILHVHAPSLDDSHRRLGNFFDTWGVVFSEDCLFQYCGYSLTMQVNGEPSEEFENYILEDQDRITLTLDTF